MKSAWRAVSGAIDEVLIAYWKERYPSLAFSVVQYGSTIAIRISTTDRATEVPLNDQWIADAMTSEKAFRTQLKALAAQVDEKIGFLAPRAATQPYSEPIAREIPILKRTNRGYDTAEA